MWIKGKEGWIEEGLKEIFKIDQNVLYFDALVQNPLGLIGFLVGGSCRTCR
jgi:hypothetical protein